MSLSEESFGTPTTHRVLLRNTCIRQKRMRHGSCAKNSLLLPQPARRQWVHDGHLGALMTREITVYVYEVHAYDALKAS